MAYESWDNVAHGSQPRLVGLVRTPDGFAAICIFLHLPFELLNALARTAVS